MLALLLISVALLFTPFFGVGLGGLVGWGILKVLFWVAGQGEEQMVAEAHKGNSGCATLFLVVIFVVVILGGLTALGGALTVADAFRP